MHPLLSPLLKLVRQAAQQFKQTGPGQLIQKEGSFNFVSEADLAVQQFLTQALRELEPKALLVGEENETPTPVPQRGTAFILDPIDGTSNFICGFNYSCVSLAYTVDAQLEIGIVYNPYSDECFYAVRGQGAYLNDEQLLPLAHRRLEGSLVCADLGTYDSSLRQRAFGDLSKIVEHTMGLRLLGCAAMAMCELAAGRLSAYLSQKLQPWDYAAAQLILEELGAVVTDRDGKDLSAFPCGTTVFTAHPEAHRQLLDLIHANA